MIVYLITNNITGFKYVGQTIKTLKRRWQHHVVDGRSSILSNAIEKYGKENFTQQILCVCLSSEDMDEKERYWIEKLNTIKPYGYNIRSGGQGKGKNIHESTKEKLREAWKHRKPVSIASRKKMSESQKRRCQENPLTISDKRKRPIICIETNEKFNSITEAGKKLGIPGCTICNILTKRQKKTRGLTFKYIDV